MSSESGLITGPFILRHLLGGAIPFIVAVVWECGVLSVLSMYNLAMAFGLDVAGVSIEQVCP